MELKENFTNDILVKSRKSIVDRYEFNNEKLVNKIDRYIGQITEECHEVLDEIKMSSFDITREERKKISLEMLDIILYVSSLQYEIDKYMGNIYKFDKNTSESFMYKITNKFEIQHIIGGAVKHTTNILGEVRRLDPERKYHKKPSRKFNKNDGNLMIKKLEMLNNSLVTVLFNILLDENVIYDVIQKIENTK